MITTVHTGSALRSHKILQKRQETALVEIDYKPSKPEPLTQRHVVHKKPSEPFFFSSLPQLDYASLFNLLQKLGIVSANLSHQDLRQRIDTLDKEIAITHKEMITEKKAARKAENAAKPWGAMAKMLGLMVPGMMLFTGCVLLASGGGLFAAIALIVAAVLSLASWALEVTGTWNLIGSKMGTDKSRSIVMWIQISIAVLSMVLGASAGIFGGGFAGIKGAMATAGIFSNMLTSVSIAMLLIGKGIIEKRYHLHMAHYKEKEKLLITLNKLERDMIIKDLAEQAHHATQWIETGNRIRKMREADDRAINMINMR